MTGGELISLAAIRSGQTIRYGNWEIHFYMPPIPCRNSDWQYCHKDYDGAEDACDNRCGHAASLIDAMVAIDDWEDEHFEEHGCSECSQGFITSCLATKCKHRDDMNARRHLYTLAMREENREALAKLLPQ